MKQHRSASVKIFTYELNQIDTLPLRATGLIICLIISACAHVKHEDKDQNWASDSRIGVAAAAKGDYQTAVRFHSRALQEAIRFGDNDPRVIQSLNDLANAFAHEKRLSEAQITYIAALKRQEKLLGSDSIALVPTLNSVIRVTCADGRCGTTLPYIRQLLAIRQKHLGASHRDSLLTMQLLGETYEKEGKLGQALKCFQEKTELTRKQFGSGDLAVLNCSSNVARILIKQKDYAKAEKLLKRMLEVEEKYDWTDSPVVDSTIKNYREVLKSTGHPAQASALIYRPKSRAGFF